MIPIKRRTFLKSAASAAAGCMAMSCAYSPLSNTYTGFPADVYIQNSLIDQAAVDETLDVCAKTLSQQTTGEQAWAAIFQKPSHKSWQEVKAAIKVNEVGNNRPRIAIINKICRALNSLGAPYCNIRIYGGPNDTIQQVSPYNQLMAELLPGGVIISQHDSALGGTKEVEIPQAVKNDMVITATKCIAEIADNTNDILVNLAVNKGHWEEFGGFTLTMKNHFGTCNPRPYPSGSFELSHGNLDYLCAISQSDFLIGATPPQQQLCIIDSIWATSALNPGVNGDDVPYNMIIMGIYSPIVDYVTAKKVRQDIMKCKLGESADTFLQKFGFTEEEINNLELIYLPDNKPLLLAKEKTHVKPHHNINPLIPDDRVVGCVNNDIVKDNYQ